MQITRSDLDENVFQDEFKSSLVAEDCKKLLSTSINSIEELENQQWYNRLWTSITGKNVRTLTKSCKTVQEVQELLLKVLEESMQITNETNHLVNHVSNGLKHVELQNKKIASRLFSLTDRVDSLQSQIKDTRHLVDVDPLDEYTWKEEDKVLLLKIVIVTALIDNLLHESEKELLINRINSFELSEPAYNEVLNFKGNFKPIIVELDHLDSYKMKKVLYKYAVAAAYVHDDISSIEKSFLKNLSEELNLNNADVKEVNNFFGLIPVGDVKGILAQIEGDKANSRRRLKKKLREQEEKREQEKKQQRKQQRRIKDLVAQIESVAPKWLDAISKRFAFIVVLPVYEYHEFLENTEVDDINELMELWSAENITNYYNQRIGEIVEDSNLREEMSEIQKYIKIENEREWLENQASLFQYFIENDAGWEQQLGILENKRGSYLERFGNKTQDWLERAGWGALGGGAAGAFLAGPVGLLAALGAGYYADKYHNKEMDEAITDVANEYEILMQKTDDWLKSNYNISYDFFEKYLRAVCESIEGQNFNEEFINLPKIMEREANVINETFE